MPSEVSAFASDSEAPPAQRAAMERALDLARRGWGRVAPNPLVGAVVLAGDAVAGEHVHWVRAGFDAIAVGGTTALRDNPQLTVRGVVTPRRPPVRVVFDRRAMLNLGVQLVSTAREVPTWVMSSLDAPSSSVAQLENSGVRVFRPTTLRDGLRMLRDA